MKQVDIILCSVEWDRALEERTRRRNELEEYCYTVKGAIEELRRGADECLKWLDESSSRPVLDDELARQKERLAGLARQVLPRD